MSEVALGGAEIQDLTVDEMDMVNGADGVVGSALTGAGTGAFVGAVAGGVPGSVIGAGIGLIAGAIIHYL